MERRLKSASALAIGMSHDQRSGIAKWSCSVRINVKQLLRERGLEEGSDESDDERPSDRKRKAAATDLDDEDVAAKKAKRNPSSAVTAVVDIVPPCCLCVSTSEEGLLRAIKPPTRLPASVVPPDVWRAHENCALIVPETWVDEIEVEGQKEKVVCGLDSIPEESWLSVSCHLSLKPFSVQRHRCLTEMRRLHSSLHQISRRGDPMQ